MLKVRFPNGVTITYNTAHHLVTSSATWNLYTADPEKKGKWIASVAPQSGCVVEAVEACKIENLLEKLPNENALLFVLEHVHDYSGSNLGALKAALKDYNSKTQSWRAA